MLVEGGAGLLQPWPLKIVLDHVIGAKAPPAWLPGWLTDEPAHLIGAAALAVIAIALVGAICSYVQRHLSTSVGTHVGYDLRRLLYHHVQRLSLSFYERQRTGDMVLRLTSDVDAIESFITSAVLGMVLDGIMIVGMLAVMFVARLAVQRHRPVHRSNPVCPCLLPVATDQERVAGRQAEGGPGGLGRSGVDRIRSCRKGARPRGIRGAPIRPGKPGERRFDAAGASVKGTARTAGRRCRGDRNGAGAVVRSAAGARRRLDGRLAHRIRVLSGADVQANEGSLEDGRHAFEGSRRLRAHRRDPGCRKPGRRSAGRVRGAAIRRARRVRGRPVRL